METNSFSSVKIKLKYPDISRRIEQIKKEMNPKRRSYEYNEGLMNDSVILNKYKIQENENKNNFNDVSQNNYGVLKTHQNFGLKILKSIRPVRLMKRKTLTLKLNDTNNRNTEPNLSKSPITKLTLYQKNRTVINRNKTLDDEQFLNSTNSNSNINSISLKLNSFSFPYQSKIKRQVFNLKNYNKKSHKNNELNNTDIFYRTKRDNVSINLLCNQFKTSPRSTTCNTIRTERHQIPLSLKKQVTLHSPLINSIHSLSHPQRNNKTLSPQHSKVIKDLINLKCQKGVKKGEKLRKEIKRNDKRNNKSKKKKKNNEYYRKKEQEEFKKMYLKEKKRPYQITTFHNLNNKYSFRTFTEKLDYLSKISDKMAFMDRKRFFADTKNFKSDSEFYFNDECQNIQHSIENNQKKENYRKRILNKQLYQAIRLFHLNKKAKEKILHK